MYSNLSTFYFCYSWYWCYLGYWCYINMMLCHCLIHVHKTYYYIYLYFDYFFCRWFFQLLYSLGYFKGICEERNQMQAPNHSFEIKALQTLNGIFICVTKFIGSYESKHTHLFIFFVLYFCYPWIDCFISHIFRRNLYVFVKSWSNLSKINSWHNLLSNNISCGI